MRNIFDFEQQLIYFNLKNINEKDIERIKGVVKEETENLIEFIPDLTGLCKYITSLIEASLLETNISLIVHWLELKELGVNVDHAILIVEYKHNDKIKRILIDPTYIQFVKRENAQLLKLDEWPSELIDPIILKELLSTGTIILDNNKFNNYLSSFGKNTKLDLDEFLMEYRKLNITKR